MRKESFYRWAGFCGLFSIVLFFSEIPMYLARGPFPTTSVTSLTTYVAQNARNMVGVTVVDMLACALLLLFLAGFRNLIGEMQPRFMWLATQIFGVGVVFCGLRLFTDFLQGTTGFNALAGNIDPSLVRAFLSRPFSTFGTVGFIFGAVSLAAASYIGHASRALPPLATGLGYFAAVLCLVIIPFAQDATQNSAQLFQAGIWGATGVAAAGTPLALWVFVVGIAMLRLHNMQARREF
jgi:hypothetical protein